MKVRLVGFAVSEDDRMTEGERTEGWTNMERLIVAFRNLYSNGTEERNFKMIKITIWFDATELVTFVHLPDIKFGRSDSY
jgi:hypothetical protein